MPKKNRKTTVSCDEICQIALTPELVDQAISLSVKTDKIIPEIMGLCQEGYSVQILYDSDRESWSVRLAGISPDCVNAGRMLYGNGEELELAFAALYVKHFLASGGKTWGNTPTNARTLLTDS